jgi:Flp pilus assembly protein TadD
MFRSSLLLSIFSILTGCATYDNGYPPPQESDPHQEHREHKSQEGGSVEPVWRDESRDNDSEDSSNSSSHNRSDIESTRPTHTYRPAVAKLVQLAQISARNGDYEQAEATLERGLRIEPQNPRLWFELARYAKAYGNDKKAREMAARAKSLAGSDRSLTTQINRFLEGF